jgi:type VI secretion system secreted protein VgrG
VTEVLNAHPFSSFENRTTGSFPNLEYCVQYNESDFDFVSRLLEEYGIYYFFEHSENDHKLILADSKSASKPKVAGPELHYYPLEQKHFQEKETLNELTAVRRFATGKFSLNDFNYMTPHASLLSERQGTAKYKNGKLELYTYPGRFEDKPGGNAAVKVRLEAEQAFDHRFDGAGDSVSCCPGALMKLMKHPQVSDGKEFLILRASHFYRSNAYVSTAAETIEQYSGRYEFLPSDMPYRPPQKTPKPRIFGPQTAFVDGEGEIDVDEHGRILVVFHWSGDRKKTLSRRVRISHGWSGTNWGDIKIPRVGMEVVVEFLNGDPDHPLVTGTVYNKDAEPPYKLPDQNTISGVKSKTVGGNGYNEFIFDDKKDDELIRLHAQRDLDSTIEHDERRKVGNDVKVEIGNNRTETIGQQWKVEAGTKIEFICGQSKIVMTPGSITLQSINIQVTAQAMLSEKAPLTQIQGSANLILQGGLVLIN